MRAFVESHIEKAFERYPHTFDETVKEGLTHMIRPQLELCYLHGHHFDSSEGLFDGLSSLGDAVESLTQTVANIVAPLPEGNQREEKLKAEGFDTAELDMAIMAKASQLLGPDGYYRVREDGKMYPMSDAEREHYMEMSETEKALVKQDIYDSFIASDTSSFLKDSLRRAYSDLGHKNVYLKISGEIYMLRKMAQDFGAEKIRQGIVLGLDKTALERTFTAENILKVWHEQGTQFAGAEPKKNARRKKASSMPPMVTFEEGEWMNSDSTTPRKDDEAMVKDLTLLTDMTKEQTIKAMQNIRSLAKSSGSLQSELLNSVLTGSGVGIANFAGQALTCAVASEFQTYLNTVGGSSAAIGLSTILFGMGRAWANSSEGNNVACQYADSVLNKLGYWVGATDRLAVAGLQRDMDENMVETVMDEVEVVANLDSQDMSADAEAWLKEKLAQYEEGPSSDRTDYHYVFYEGMTEIDWGPIRELLDDIFRRMPTYMPSYVSVHFYKNDTGPGIKYYEFKYKDKTCIFTKRTASKLVACIESLPEKERNLAFEAFHKKIPMPREQSLLLEAAGVDASPYMNENNVYSYTTNDIMNILVQADRIDMMRGLPASKEYVSMTSSSRCQTLMRWLRDAVLWILSLPGRGVKLLLSMVGKMVRFLGLGRLLDLITDGVSLFWDRMIRGANAVGYATYRAAVTIVDFVANHQVLLMLANVVACAVGHGVVLSSMGIPLGSSVMVWQTCKLVGRMMGMQLIHGLAKVLYGVGTLYGNVFSGENIVGTMLNYGFGRLGTTLSRIWTALATLTSTVAPASYGMVQTGQTISLLGAAGAMGVGGLQYAGLIALGPAAFVGTTAVFGVTTIAGMFSQTAGREVAFWEAFINVSKNMFDIFARNVLYNILFKPWKDAVSVLTANSELTLEMLMQPTIALNIVCSVLNTGWAGRTCRKLQRILVKVWGRAFAVRFLFGIYADVVCFAGFDPFGLGQSAWSYGNCASQFRHMVLPSVMKVQTYIVYADDNTKYTIQVDVSDGRLGISHEYSKTQRAHIPNIRRITVQRIGAAPQTQDVEAIYLNTISNNEPGWELKRTYFQVSDEGAVTKHTVGVDIGKTLKQKITQEVFGEAAYTLDDNGKKNFWIYNLDMTANASDTSVVYKRHDEFQTNQLLAGQFRQKGDYILTNKTPIAVYKHDKLRTLPVSATFSQGAFPQNYVARSFELDEEASRRGIFRVSTYEREGSSQKWCKVYEKKDFRDNQYSDDLTTYVEKEKPYEAVREEFEAFKASYMNTQVRRLHVRDECTLESFPFNMKKNVERLQKRLRDSMEFEERVVIANLKTMKDVQLASMAGVSLKNIGKYLDEISDVTRIFKNGQALASELPDALAGLAVADANTQIDGAFQGYASELSRFSMTRYEKDVIVDKWTRQAKDTYLQLYKDSNITSEL